MCQGCTEIPPYAICTCGHFIFWLQISKDLSINIAAVPIHPQWSEQWLKRRSLKDQQFVVSWRLRTRTWANVTTNTKSRSLILKTGIYRSLKLITCSTQFYLQLENSLHWVLGIYHIHQSSIWCTWFGLSRIGLELFRTTTKSHLSLRRDYAWETCHNN